MQTSNELRLCAFADEAAPDIDGQLAALRRNGIRLLELRGVDGQPAVQLTLAQAKELRRRLDEAGIAVWAIGSPLGKVALDEPSAPQLELLRHTLELGEVLGARVLRLFSFYLPQGADPAACWPRVAARMEEMLRVAAGSPLVLCHENEKGIYGDVAARCLQLHQTFPALRAVFDPANFIQCGQAVWPAWQQLAPYVEYLHVKDALPDGRVVPAGQGVGCWRELLAAWRQRGGTLTLEPHLRVFAGLQSLEQAGKTSDISEGYPSAEVAFDAAAAALRGLLGQADA